MRILWITYAPLGSAASLIENVQTQSGTWIDATASEITMNNDVELGIACIASHDVKIVDNGVTYWGVSGISRISGIFPTEKEKKKWKNIIDEFVPDIIMVWGTEYANGYSIIEESHNTPVLFFIQGVIGRIIEYPFGLLPKKEVMREIGLMAMLKFLHFQKNYKDQKKQKFMEIEMIKKSSGIITDSHWADSYYRSLSSQTKIFHLPLPVNKFFLEGKYNVDNIEENTIFTIDGYNPAKGMFHLIKALKIVKRTIPDVKLYIPGRVPNKKPEFIYESPYYTYLKRLIRKNGLEDNVVFCNQLSSQQMKEHLLSCAAFVMPSCIENHSSSLREAMYLGVPSITSMVGSVDEFTKSGENVLSYRYEEESALADCIIQILLNKKYAKMLGNNAYHSIRESYPQEGIGDKLIEIYKLVIGNE